MGSDVGLGSRPPDVQEQVEGSAGRRSRAPDFVAVVACAAPLGAALFLAFRSGGYFVATRGAVTIALLALLGGVAIALRSGLGGWLGRTALLSWIGLAAWQGASSWWAKEPAAATGAMALTLLYAAAFGLPLAALRRRSWLGPMLAASTLVAAAVAAYAVAARLLPGLVPGDDETRLSTPITYWNSLGALLAFGGVLAVGLAGHASRRLPLRATAGALVPLFLLGILCTVSRGAALALLAGLAALLVLAPGRLETFAALLTTVGASIPLLLYANDQAGIVEFTGDLPPHDAQGRSVGLALLVTMLGSGVASALAGYGLARLRSERRRRLAFGVGIASALAALALLVGFWPQGGPVGWADRQLDAFRTLSGRDESSSSISDRFAVAASSGRWQHWEVAGEQFRSSPVVGTGAGDYRFWWNEGRPFPFFVVNVHNLYLETLAESGIVGLALLVLPGLALVVAVALAVRSRPRFALARDLGVTLAAVAVYAVHTAGDWDWQLPAVLLPAVALAGAALKASTLQLGSMRRPSLLVPALLLAVSVAGVLLVAGPTASASRVDSGRAHAAAGRLEVALGHARQAERLDGRNPQAFLLEAYVLTDLGRTAAANRAYATALARSPSDWSIMADWSAALVRTGNRRAARLLVERALELNPKEPRLAFLRESVRS